MGLPPGFVHQLVGVQNQSHGAVVDGRYLHVGTKLAVLGRITQFCADGQKLFIQGITQLGTGSIGKCGVLPDELPDHAIVFDDSSAGKSVLY